LSCKKLKQVLGICILLLLISIGYRFSALMPLNKFPEKMYGVFPAESYMSTLAKMFQDFEKNTTVFLFVEDDSDLFLLLEFFKNNTRHKVRLINYHWAFNSIFLSDYSKFLLRNENYVVVSDRQFEGIFNDAKGARKPGELTVYEPTWFREHGYAVIFGTNLRSEWKLRSDWVTVKVILPEELKGKEVRLGLDFSSGEPLPPGTGADLVFFGSKEVARASEFDGKVWGVASSELTEAGLIIASVRLTGPVAGTRDTGLILDRITVVEAR
jgi:hypothetical protein